MKFHKQILQSETFEQEILIRISFKDSLTIFRYYRRGKLIIIVNQFGSYIIY